MGLDMYLKVNDKQGNRVNSKLYYWRKANQIRNWFVNHIDRFEYDSNCTEYIVPEETIYQLIKDIEIVLDDRNNINGTKNRKIMPTSSGFFFGSQEYDEEYYEQLKDTHNALKQIIKDFDFSKYDIVYDEWW